MISVDGIFWTFSAPKRSWVISVDVILGLFPYMKKELGDSVDGVFDFLPA